MTLNAGQQPTAATVLHLQPVIYSAGQSNTGAQTFTTTEADSVGATVTFTTATAAKVVVNGVGDFEVTSASAAIVAIGRLNVDGSTVTGAQEMHLRADSLGRATVAGLWDFNVSGAGSHTVKLRLLKSGAGGAMQANDNHTRIVVWVLEVV